MADNICTKENILEIIKKENILFVRLQFVDILGNPKNIVIPPTRLEEALDDGIPFDGSSVAGYATIEESDKIAKPDPCSFVILPEEIEKRKTAKLNCDIYEPDGKRFIGDTKFALEKMVNKAKNLGYVYKTGPECEFFLFKKEDDNYSLTPNDAAGYFDLSHRDLAEGVRADVSIALEAFGIKTYTSHHEVSRGQHEINFHYDDALITADRVITLKYVTKVIAKTHNLHASFMPKPVYGLNGSGMHTHLSLFTMDGKNAFHDRKTNQLSTLARQFIGGLLEHIKEITAVLNPTVNSYKRLVPGYEAPTYISWAHRNRSALIRIPTGRGENSTRCELRSPDLSGNPYLQFAVMLAAGLAGIERETEPPDSVEKNIYALSIQEREKYNIHNLPESLGHALSFMENSEMLKETLGPHIFENFLYVKRKEWNEYRTQVTKWEIDKYLPII